MKLLKLRVEFRENTLPISNNSQFDASVLNHFKVPFRVKPYQKSGQSEEKVILLKGDKNTNLDNSQWHAFPGFVARLLQAGTKVANKDSKKLNAMSLKKQERLDVRVIDVSEWRRMSESEKMDALNMILHTKQAPKAQKASMLH